MTKLKVAVRVDPNPAYWCPYKRRKIGHTKIHQGCRCTEENHVRTQLDGGHPQAKGRGLRGKEISFIQRRTKLFFLIERTGI